VRGRCDAVLVGMADSIGGRGNSKARCRGILAGQMTTICIDRAIQGMGDVSRGWKVTRILLVMLLQIRGGAGNDGRLKYLNGGLNYPTVICR
jgi:hypothetical protein